MPADLARIYQQFATRPLRSDEDDLYVDLGSARGDSQIVRRLADEIRLSAEPTCRVLAGHDGSGKSTELQRLARMLETGAKRFFVVNFSVDEDVDRNDVDFPEILVAIIRQVALQLRERANISLKPGYLKDRFDRLKKLLGSEVAFDSAEIDARLLTLSATIKNSPDARLEIRKLLEPDTANWLHAVNDLLSEAAIELHKKGYHGLVVIADDLDKMVLRRHDAAGCSTQEYLFVHRAAQLRAFACHLIYTMPIELAYSHHEQAIESLYGGRIPVIPMTKIATRPPRSKPHRPGIELFRDLIERRVLKAGASMAETFQNPAVCEELIRLSGGQPTEIMTMMREALIAEDLPISSRSLDRPRTEGRRSYARQFREEHWPILHQVRASGTLARAEKNEIAFRELLESRAILLYSNNEEWYALNPLVEPLIPPDKPRKKKKK